MASKAVFTLNSGYKIPAVGLGTWQSKPNEVTKAVETALKAGYRHIDGASMYQNEAEVGQGIAAAGVPREEIFLTSKVWNHCHRAKDVERSVDQSLKDLGVSYLDLCLIHWPVAFAPGDNPMPRDKKTGIFQLDTEVTIQETWKAMEAMVKKGKVRSIGVSNFNKARIEEIFSFAEIPPAVNQIEAHPFLQQPGLKEYMDSKNMVLEAFSPLGNNLAGHTRVIDHPLVQKIAEELGISAARVLISWAYQRGTVVLAKSVTPERIIDNFKDFDLPASAMEQITSLECHGRHTEPYVWGIDIFGEKGDEYAKEAARKHGEENPIVE